MTEKLAGDPGLAVIAWPDTARGTVLDADLRMEEAAGLARAISLECTEVLQFPIRTARPATLFGSGQLDRIAAALESHGAGLLIVDGALSAIQQRNLEDRLQVKVIDRTGLILEIFGERAATAEGRLQVELAHLEYQSGRLVRSWTHLERQRGGFGFLGGPGETQIEADRRMIRNRIARLRREIADLRKTRGLHRDRRQRAPWPVVALVGYTNAGKSTLFNRLTNAGVMAEDLLFATLDPTMRAFPLPGYDKAILSDTVGFVSELPTQLVAAFRATLEEVTAADVIIHVRDISHPASAMQAAEVARILGELGIGNVDDGEGESAEREPGPPIIEAWNKIDLADPDLLATQLLRAERKGPVYPMSAITGEGVDVLLEAVTGALSSQHRSEQIILPVDEGRKLAWLHENGRILEQTEADGVMQIEVSMSERNWGRFAGLDD